MKNIAYNLFIALVLIFSGACKEECPKIVKPVSPYEQEIYEFQVVDMGQIEKGYCGSVIIAHLDSLSTTLIKFKAIDLPEAIIAKPSVYYKGFFRIYPTIYSCKDGRPEPLPDQESPTVECRFVDILSWERKS